MTGGPLWEPVRSPLSLPARIAGHVRGLIAAGVLGPGDRLPGERELAGLLAVSRSSVREAVRSLAAVGFVSVRHGHGVVVGPSAAPGDGDDSLLAAGALLTGRQAGEYYAMREALEVPAARWAAQRITPDGAARLDSALARLGNAGPDATPQDRWRLNAAFHTAIALAAGNTILSQVLQSCHQVAGPRTVSRSWPVPGCRHREEMPSAGHAAIVRAITAGDAHQAGQAAQAHIHAARAAVCADCGNACYGGAGSSFPVEG